jgi:23S rRNA U2552 (ribose-2'-O)-methylase RlmE/FtsJ
MQVAIDLGAAPGAWTQVLAEQTSDLVIAVDPAELSDACLALANVVHVKCVSRIAGEVITRLLDSRPVDIIVCDMNMLPHRAADCVEPLLQYLVPGGYLIMTCKLMGNGRDRCTSKACENLQNGSNACHLRFRHVQLSRKRTCFQILDQAGLA